MLSNILHGPEEDIHDALVLHLKIKRTTTIKLAALEKKFYATLEDTQDEDEDRSIIARMRIFRQATELIKPTLKHVADPRVETLLGAQHRSERDYVSRLRRKRDLSFLTKIVLHLIEKN